MALAEANAMPATAFIAAFGDVAEHAPWVAERAAEARPFADREAMIEAFAGAVRSAPARSRLALIRAHPDLAGKAAVAGDLTDESRREQAAVRLDTMTPEEFARFSELNRRYGETFGFPFIFAVRGATKQQILAGFEARLANDPENEFQTATAQVARIIRFRLEARVRP